MSSHQMLSFQKFMISFAIENEHELTRKIRLRADTQKTYYDNLMKTTSICAQRTEPSIQDSFNNRRLKDNLGTVKKTGNSQFLFLQCQLGYQNNNRKVFRILGTRCPSNEVLKNINFRKFE